MWFEQLHYLGGSENQKATFQWEFEVSQVTKYPAHFHKNEQTQVLYKDLDGTLTGLDGGGWALPNSELVPPELCTASVPAFSNYTAINGTICSREVNFLRMAWNRAEPLVCCCYDTVIIHAIELSEMCSFV